MRAALEQRLRALHASTGLPLDRLRKEVALQRLLARIAAAAPDGSWALKGGIAMIARSVIVPGRQPMPTRPGGPAAASGRHAGSRGRAGAG